MYGVVSARASEWSVGSWVSVESVGDVCRGLTVSVDAIMEQRRGYHDSRVWLVGACHRSDGACHRSDSACHRSDAPRSVRAGAAGRRKRSSRGICERLSSGRESLPSTGCRGRSSLLVIAAERETLSGKFFRRSLRTGGTLWRRALFSMLLVLLFGRLTTYGRRVTSGVYRLKCVRPPSFVVRFELPNPFCVVRHSCSELPACHGRC